MSKAHDESTRKTAARGSTSDETMTPAPARGVPVAVAPEASKGAVRRPRAVVPRERSGPIGIASGDFSTPTVRRRTTTQPRGTPIVDRTGGAESEADESATPGPSDEPTTGVVSSPPTVDPVASMADPAAATLTPAPQLDDGVVGAQPLEVAGAPQAAPSAEDSPFASPRPSGGDLGGEAAALAAEAAAVRALDSGPLTPPPDLTSNAPTPIVEAHDALVPPQPQREIDDADTPTPPPEALASSGRDVAASLTEALAAVALQSDRAAEPTPSPQVNGTSPDTDMPTPPPEVVAAPEAEAVATPAPAVVASEARPVPEALVPEPQATPAPMAEPQATPAPMAEPQATPAPMAVTPVDARHETPAPGATEIAEFDDRVTPPPIVATATPESVAPVTESAGALPELAMGSEGADTPADIPLITVPAEALTDPPVDADGGTSESEGDDPMVVVDGDEASGPVTAAPPRPPSRVPTLKAATPPPIPGSVLRTPGPDLVQSLAAVTAVTAGVDGAATSPPGLPILPEALAQRPRRPKRAKPWFEEVFDEDYLRTLPFLRPDQTLREVEFISDALRLTGPAELLDIGCGYGRHAIELVQRGFAVTGLDLSLPLLIRAADEAQRRGLSVNFVHADMREMSFEKQFDGAYSMLTSFGYFDEESNLRVAERIGRALKPGGRLLLDIVNRDYVVADLPTRVWWEGTGCVVLEEVDFNFHTSRIVTHRSVVFEDGRQLEQEISVRAYSLHEIGRLLRQAGFRVIDVSGGLATRGQFFGSSSRSLLILAEKREDGAT